MDKQHTACILQEIEDVKKGGAFFTCVSGELLWGQMHTLVEGSTSTAFDTELGPREIVGAVEEEEGGISTCSFCYKVAARKGLWKVEPAFQDNFEGKPWHIGYVCHHADVNGLEILRRASEAGICNNGKFADLDIVFVDRYDWSGAYSPGCELVVEAVKGKKVDPDEDFEDDGYYRSLVYGRFMLMDARGLPNLMQALKDGKRLEQENYVMRYKDDSADSKPLGDEKTSSNCEEFGTHLVVDDTEYDMGWMVFQKGELVGFVYDGAYSALEGDNLRLGDNLVTP